MSDREKALRKVMEDIALFGQGAAVVDASGQIEHVPQIVDGCAECDTERDAERKGPPKP